MKTSEKEAPGWETKGCSSPEDDVERQRWRTRFHRGQLPASERGSTQREAAQQQRVSLNVPSPNTPSPTASEKTSKDIILKPATIPTPNDDQKKESTSVRHMAPVLKVVQVVYIEPFYFPAGKCPKKQLQNC